MKPFHLNMGYLFEQPYESAYNILRRCLICNPGVPLTLIETNLRLLVDESTSTMSRLQHLKRSSDDVQVQVELPKSYQRQCPQCAKCLYHTDVYILPWLTHCPIHHCELTTTCPNCQQHWPDNNELTTRDCATCGLLTLDQIHQHVLTGMEGMRYSAIEDIIRFVKPRSINEWIDLKSYNIVSTFPYSESQWWKQSSYMDTLFPSLNLRHYKHVFNETQKTLKIAIKPMRQRTSCLYLFDIHNYKVEEPQPSKQRLYSLLFQVRSTNLNNQGRFGT